MNFTSYLNKKTVETPLKSIKVGLIPVLSKCYASWLSFYNFWLVIGKNIYQDFRCLQGPLSL